MTLDEFVDAYVTDRWESILTICNRAAIKTYTDRFGGARSVRELSSALRDTKTRPAGVQVKWDNYAGTYLFKRERV